MAKYSQAATLPQALLILEMKASIDNVWRAAGRGPPFLFMVLLYAAGRINYLLAERTGAFNKGLDNRGG